MSIYTDKKTKRLFIQFDFQGKTYKKRLPEKTTKRDAEKLETKFKNKLFFEANGIEVKQDIVFERFVARYFLPYAKANYTEESYKNCRHICRASLPFFKGRNMRQIKAADVERFKTYRANLETQYERARKPATVIRELGIISKIFSLAIKNDFLDFNPCSRVERPVCDNLQNYVLAPEIIQKFLDSFESDWARDIAILMLHTGLRQNDALGLSKFNIDLSNRVIRLLQGKTGRKVEIPINDVVESLIRARWNNGSDLIFPSPKTGRRGTSIKKALEGACKRAKIDKAGTRVLRRTFGTRLDELNYDSMTVAKLLGHSDLRSVHRYKRGTNILREAVDALAHPAKILPLNQNTEAQKAVND